MKNKNKSVKTLEDGNSKKSKSGSERSFKDTLGGVYENLVEEYKSSMDKFKNLKGTNYKLGIEHFDRGNFYDARTRFRILSWFAKDYPAIDYYCGRCFLEEGKFKKAKERLDSPEAEKALEEVMTLLGK